MMESKTEHVFIESIIYCPSQIYYYFKDMEGSEWCAYVRQRGGPLTFKLLQFIKGKWTLNGAFYIALSRTYDINNQPNQEAEEREIEALESEIMWYLRQQFPEVTFPTQPERQKRITE